MLLQSLGWLFLHKYQITIDNYYNYMVKAYIVALKYTSIVLGCWCGNGAPSRTCLAVLRGCTAT